MSSFKILQVINSQKHGITENHLCIHQVRKVLDDPERDMTYHCLRECFNLLLRSLRIFYTF